MKYQLQINECEFDVFYLRRANKRLMKNALRDIIELSYNNEGS